MRMGIPQEMDGSRISIPQAGQGPRCTGTFEALNAPVSIVVLTWNGLEDTKACLQSLAASRGPQVEIVVADNGSSDGTVEYLRSVQGIRTIFNGNNLGFVKGNNIALQSIESNRDVILLNNDTVVRDLAWIRKLQESAYRAEDIGVVGCRIRRLGSDILQHAGTFMPDLTYWGQQIAGGEKDINQYSRDHDVEGVVFACVYLKRSVLKRVGFLDEAYFSYFEDSDYCLKARAAGFRIVVCGALTIEHREHGASAANAVDVAEMFGASQKTFRRKWKRVLDERYSLDITWHSTFFRPIGYAMPSRALALGLERSGVRVAYKYLYGPGTVYPVPEDRRINSGNYQIEIIRQRKPVVGAPQVIFGQADAFSSVAGRCRIGYTMLETTGVPSEWVRQCNELEELWVPSPFNEWTFRRSGVKRPIKVMPLGVIDTNYFNPFIKGYPIEGTFTFLSIFEWGERKAPDILLRAFNQAFRRTEPVVLICKFVNDDPSVVPRDQIDALQLDPEGGRILLSENERVPFYQLPQIYRSADCFVLTTRGEGWGMPILEAMACGLPVIASYWSAQQHYMRDSNSYPLQVDLVAAQAKCPYYEGFKWAEPDRDHLAKLLRHVYENQTEAKGKGAKAALDVEAKWSLEVCSEALRSRLSQIVEHPSHHRPAVHAETLRIGLDVCRAIGHEVTGIGRYVVGLLRGLTRLGTERMEYEFLLLPGFGSFVHPDYLRSLTLENPDADRFTIYRGPLPAFGDTDRYVPGLGLVHCTGNDRPAAVDVPSVFTVYDLTFATHPEFHTEENVRLCKRGFEKAVNSDCHFVAISESSKIDMMRCYGITEDRISVVPCAVDTREFALCSATELRRIRDKYNLPDRYFLCVGSLEPRKNLASAIAAMQRYTGPEPLIVVGASGWRNSQLRELLAKSQDRVRLLGYVPQEDLPGLYGGAVASIYPSHYEGFGLPVVESMACGTPVVTSRHSALGEVAAEAALLVDDPCDVGALARHLEQIAEDDELRSSLSRNGVARAALFSPERCAEQMMRVYDRVLRGQNMSDGPSVSPSRH